MKTVFLRALESEDKNRAILTAIHDSARVFGTQRFEVDSAGFASMPRSPFAYWVSDSLRALFARFGRFETDGRNARQGLASGDDFRFVRVWWEVPSNDHDVKWFPFAKGGTFSPFYSDVHLMVNWKDGGREISNLLQPGSDRSASRPQNTNFFFRPGLTWPRRTKSKLAFRVMPAGCVFGDKGPAAFIDGDDEQELLAVLSVATKRDLSIVDRNSPRGCGRKAGRRSAFV